MKPSELLCPTPKGLYCPPGDFYIDPVRAVARAVVTHGHADHARRGHQAVAATAETIAIMQTRMGEGFAGSAEALRYGQTIVRNGVEVSLVPAGHVLGSAQVVVRSGAMKMVVSGDYKRARDPTCPPFEIVPCDVFITEATFGLPVFVHPDASQEIGRLLKSVAQFPERTHLVGAYSLGKAQRVIALLREAGYDRTIYTHGALDSMNALYARFGVDLGPLLPAGDEKKPELAGAIVVAPPDAIADEWSRNFPDPLAAFASGWMRVRARARQRRVELPLVISDHAGWDELTRTIGEIAPGEVWITHGTEEGLLRWCSLNGHRARALELVGREETHEPAIAID